MNPEYFDKEKFWLLATLSRKVMIRGKERPEYEWSWCSQEHGEIFWMGRTVETGVYSSDRWPGGSWTFREFLETLNTPEKLLPRIPSFVHHVWKVFHLEWFRPILERLAAGQVVSYVEADKAHREANQGKELRLYPYLAPVPLEERWEEEMVDYDY